MNLLCEAQDDLSKTAFTQAHLVYLLFLQF